VHHLLLVNLGRVCVSLSRESLALPLVMARSSRPSLTAAALIAALPTVETLLGTDACLGQLLENLGRGHVRRLRPRLTACRLSEGEDTHRRSARHTSSPARAPQTPCIRSRIGGRHSMARLGLIEQGTT